MGTKSAIFYRKKPPNLFDNNKINHHISWLYKKVYELTKNFSGEIAHFWWGKTQDKKENDVAPLKITQIYKIIKKKGIQLNALRLHR